MAEWMVDIIGGAPNVNWSDWFDSPRLNVVNEQGLYRLKSSEFNQFDSLGFTESTAEKVRSYAIEKLLPVINGIMKLHLRPESYKPVLAFGPIVLLADDGKVKVFHQHRQSIGFPLEFDDSDQWADLALEDEMVWGVLDRFGTQTTGASLRQVYEFIEEDLSGHPHKVAKIVDASEYQIKGFLNAIQEPKHTGSDAAHAPTPKRMRKGGTYYTPMDLIEAEAFARKLVVDYLCWKVKSRGATRP